MSWKELVDDRYIIAGSPETVRQQMEELIKTLRVGHIFCLMQIGNMPAEKVKHSSRLFAEKVMPHLKNIWGEDSHDDRFWIHPLEERAVPAPIPVAATAARPAMVAE